MKIATIVGARPQFIKAATVSRCIDQQNNISEVLIHTGQHYNTNMSNVFFAELDIRKPDYHLGIGGGSHGENTGRMIEAIEKVLLEESPNWAFVYGDTDSTLGGTLAAVKLHIPVAHVEAGLRSFNRSMPEEINRVLTDHAADRLFVPTQNAVKNLESEGISSDKIKLVGDVMYDATLYYQTKAYQPAALKLQSDNTPFVLCTIHRAENTDDTTRLKAIIRTLNQIAERMPVILPLHPRTAVALSHLDSAKLAPVVQVIKPVSFLEMTWLLNHCALVITDSGGLQKEAYFHQRPCLILRNETEWVELVKAGYNQLITPFETDTVNILNKMLELNIPKSDGLFGSGDAAEKIIDSIRSE